MAVGHSGTPVRDLALPMNLVDNKVCAISDIWSGLRVVWRKEHRRRDPTWADPFANPSRCPP